MRALRFYCLLFLLPVMAPANAYRPFDGTDAAVAGAGEFELELGPFVRLREGPQHIWLAPEFVANWGIGNNSELVFEGKRRAAGNSLIDTAFSLKHVHHKGILQGEVGASIASECGLLLPGIRADHGSGASCALIVSRRWHKVLLHFNSALAFSRRHKWAPFAGIIGEGPAFGKFRPVVEVTVQKEASEARTTSALAGLIWKRSEGIAVDVGVRRTHGAAVPSSELRFGFSWSH